jgi:hypothetical protein
MALADLDAYKTALGSGREVLPLNIVTSTVVLGRPHDLWRFSVPLGAIPTTAAVPDKDTLGAIGPRDAGSGLQNSIVGYRLSALNPGAYIICDRLAHSGGLSGTTTGAQTTNLPTPTLTRHTSGVGVMIGLTIYTAIGTTATTVSATYTNQGGTGSRVTPLVQIGATGFNGVNRMILLPLQDGDSGVKSVESVTLTASTVSAAGNFGVTLFKPLYTMCVESTSGVASGGFVTGLSSGGIPAVENGACLFPIAISLSTNAACAGTIIMDEN